MRAWHIIRIVLGLLSGVFVLIAAIAAVVYLPRLTAPPAPDAGAVFTRAEFITIILAAVTVVLAALTIILAVAGAVGYVTIRDAARAAAEAKATEIATARAETVATRVAEQTVTNVAGRNQRAGDEIAKAAGDEDAGTN